MNENWIFIKVDTQEEKLKVVNLVELLLKNGYAVAIENSAEYDQVCLKFAEENYGGSSPIRFLDEDEFVDRYIYNEHGEGRRVKDFEDDIYDDAELERTENGYIMGWHYKDEIEEEEEEIEEDTDESNYRRAFDAGREQAEAEEAETKERLHRGRHKKEAVYRDSDEDEEE